MTISIWRFSHLTLAISSAFFILIASLTGIILAFEPISNKINPYNVADISSVSIAETIRALEKEYNEIITIKVDENDFISASVIKKDSKSTSFYINPKTGKNIGNLIQKSPIFEFATNLHRSLFLKSTGRFIIGFVSLLLLLIAITGTILIAKRQGGFRKIFSKIVKEDFNQYYHIILSRYAFIPIVIITLTGFYLSLEKFSLLPNVAAVHEKVAQKPSSSDIKPTNFSIFKSTKLSAVKELEFPFSSDEEDYFYLKLETKEIAIHQKDGQIISEKKQGWVSLVSYYSIILHTGKGSIIWSIILLLSCLAILFFIFSGFSMTLKRTRTKTMIRNKFTKDEAEYIVLVGSETGSTFNFANAFYYALLKVRKKVFITTLNEYTTYKKAKNIIIFTATYGAGEAPINANKFMKNINKIKQQKMLKFAVVGFGSKAYPEFCKFAILVHASLQIHKDFIPTIPVFKIDNQSFKSFIAWVKEWSFNNQLVLTIHKEDIVKSSEENIDFKIIKKTDLNIDDTFLIQIKPTEKIKFVSGDLLSINLTNENKNRVYSVAKIDKTILLSIKKHELGACSTYISKFSLNENLSAHIQENKQFHFPEKATEIILISNGTGIAPFLGMIQKNKKQKVYLFWGGKTKESLNIYKDLIKVALEKKSLSSFFPVFSQEQQEKIYVQDILKNHTDLITNVLKNGNVIMICGSIAMQKGVTNELDKIVKNDLKISLNHFINRGQIKTDCY
ncbi:MULTISPECIES: PepSY domain-containing protein [unclassified Polaribacter]|uniref:PepSY domain-containing protein n=1 Tax=unclassified Polaribacter TaxID=196858 RepID=UPI0011BE856F|nr:MULTISPECIES: PepSY domain-containing protein [unclassified Polaribacter]TXD54429.1 FAD-binding oxidoreductase [Polaribacter sp. IC063]TXD60342.1 FAD-binding oxidoreductase [Polaribacter sp. IC066]